MTPEYKLTTEDNGLRFTAIKGEQTKSSYIDLGGIGGTDYAIGGNLGVTENSTVYIEKNIDAGLTDLNENDHTVMVNSEYLPLTSSNSTTGTVIVGGNGAQPNLSEGTNATIVGANTSFSATNNTVVGTQASATGDNASAIGAQSEATGVNSVALGYNSKATGDDVVSVGNNEESLLRRITGVFPATLDKDGLKPADADSNDSQNGTSLFDAVTRYDLEESRIHPGDGLAIEYDSTDYLAGEALNPTGTNVTVTNSKLSVNYDNSTIGINSDNQLAVIKDYADKSHTHTKDEITDLPTVKDGVSVTASDTFYKFVEGESPATPDTPTAKTGTPEGWYTNETDAVGNENLLTVDYENSYVTSIYTSSFAKEASSEDGGHYVYAITTGSDCTTWGGGVHNVGTGIRVPYGKTLCVSCEVYSDVATTWAVDVNNYAWNADNWNGNDNDETGKRTRSGTEIPAGQWTRIWFAYSNTSSLNTTQCDIYDCSNWGVSVAGVSYKMRRIKYEFSSEPTPYGIDLSKTSGAVFRTVRTTLSDGTALYTTPSQISTFKYALKAYQTAEGSATKWTSLEDSIEQYNKKYGAQYDIGNAILNLGTQIQQNAEGITLKADSDTVVGANLITGTRDFDEVDGAAWNNIQYWNKQSETYKGLTVYARKEAWAGLSTLEHYEAGTYTWSCYAKASAELTTCLFTNDDNSASGDLWGMPAISTEWSRVSVTFEAEKAFWRPRLESGQSDITLYICGIKLEKGTVATPWCATAEELTTSAQLKIESGRITEEVKGTYATKDGLSTLTNTVTTLDTSTTDRKSVV